MRGTIVEGLTKWVMSVDRRMFVMKALDGNGPFNASEIAEHSGRSVQNISRAIHELEEKGLIECLTPEKHTWKRYLLTDKGKAIFMDLKARGLVQ
jgi:DNA-binding MarR family transcriptional regulator